MTHRMTDLLIDGALCRSRAGLFTEWARALSFPGHFGRNWDAFYDCLIDLGAVTIVVDSADELLADEPDQLDTFRAAVRDATTGTLLGGEPTGLRVVLR